MNYKIGDRFERIFKNSDQKNSIWECVEIKHNNKYSYDRYFGICVMSTNEKWPVGCTDLWNFEDAAGWNYIGNFSKSSNFNNLYEILSGR